MKWYDRMMEKKYNYLIWVFLLFCQNIYSESSSIIPRYDTQRFRQEIEYLYQHILWKPESVSKRTEKISHYFLGRPYILGALGEGNSSLYDKSPLFRTDAFDCATFVSTVLALVTSNHYLDFEKQFKKIQYKNSVVSYFNRHHFIETDWNVTNEQNGLIIDITSQISSDYKIASVIIDKPQWFSHLSAENLKYFSPPTSKKIAALIASLHHYAKKVKPTMAHTRYIPLTGIIQGQGINNAILDRIPSGAIIQIIDKNRHLKTKIGTELNIVHLGFAIRNQAELLFRHASKVHHKIVDVPLAQYLRRYYELTEDPSNVGIHVEAVSSPKMDGLSD